MAVQVPNKAIAASDDLLAPVRELLQGLNLLPTAEELQAAGKASAAITGPPQSVALIESGATAAAKWWSAGAGATIAATWGSVVAWWGGQDAGIKSAVVWSAAIVSAALILAIGHLLASDVRGRASAATATISARETIAVQWVRSAVEAYQPGASGGSPFIAVPPMRVSFTKRPRDDESGWRVVALERDDAGALTYVVVKGSQEHRAAASELIFADS
jgi:hypothetical protein